MKNYLFTLLLMTITVAGASAYDFEVDGIYYSIWGDEVAVTCHMDYVYVGEDMMEPVYYYDYVGDVVIPETVIYYGDTYPVTAIDNEAFCGCTELTGITIPAL